MKSFSGSNTVIIAAAVMLACSSCGKSGGGTQSAASTSAPVDANATATHNNNYVTRANMPIVSAASPDSGDQNSTAAVLPRGTGVTILETKQDERLGSLVHLGVDSDDPSLPSDVWVKMSDSTLAGFAKVPEAEDAAFADARSDDGSVVDVRGRRGRGGMTYCYRYVKQYLMKVGLMKTYLPGGSAYMAAKTLPRYGFHKTGSGPESAQINDVCVYHGGRGNNGHIEVRVAGGWYWGYGIKPHSITRVNHPFLGCFRK